MGKTRVFNQGDVRQFRFKKKKKKRIKDKTSLIGCEGNGPCFVCLHRWITQHVMKEGETVSGEEAENW